MGPRVDRVLALLDAAKSEVSPDVMQKIVLTTGLSEPGVRLGLREYLETDATLEDIETLVARTPIATRVHVILSANVFVSALRAIAIGVAASERVTVKPSSREPHFAEWLVSKLNSPNVRIEDTAVSDIGEGEIHVYGKNETIAAISSHAHEGVVVRGHGTGMGVAVLIDGGEIQPAASELARDIAIFDQRGCLSPRFAIVTEETRAREFGLALHESLTHLETTIPRGTLDVREKEEAQRYLSAAAFAGDIFTGSTHIVSVGSSLVIPPTGRFLHVIAVPDEAMINRMLAPIASIIVTVGVTSPERFFEWAPRHARLAKFGRMQKPRFDGPVDRREF